MTERAEYTEVRLTVRRLSLLSGGERSLTALAFLWFADKPVDAGVFEVGMGGRWDATNLVRSEVAVICSIDLDHPELGSTIAEVAREKAAIIKEGSTVVLQDSQPVAALGATGGRRIPNTLFDVLVNLVGLGRRNLADRPPRCGLLGGVSRHDDTQPGLEDVLRQFLGSFQCEQQRT